jgi:thioredoxin 1
MARKITDSEFQELIDNSTKPVLVDFWADWCGPCRMLGPILEEISKEYEGKLEVVKLNIDENPETPTKLGVRSIPTLMLFNNGKLMSTKVGASPKSNIIEWIDSI